MYFNFFIVQEKDQVEINFELLSPEEKEVLSEFHLKSKEILFVLSSRNWNFLLQLFIKDYHKGEVYLKKGKRKYWIMES